jgi:hypothetical protein
MQTVDIDKLQQLDFVAMVLAPDDEGNYLVVSGEWGGYVNDALSEGTNNVYVRMFHTRRESVNVVTRDRTTETEFDDDVTMTIDEEDQPDMKFYLITPHSWGK